MAGRTARRRRMLLMDAFALALYAAFGAVAFGWRTWLQWRRTGDTGLRIAARPGSVQWWSKLAFIAALVAGVAAPVAGVAGMERLDVFDHASLRLAGAVVAGLGIVTTALAQWQMGASWRIGVDDTERTELVTSGVFAYVRNPIFTAMLIAATGFTLLVANVVAVAAFVALVAALEVQVRAVEEPYLFATHGSAYLAYASRAGRFVPNVGQLEMP